VRAFCQAAGLMYHEVTDDPSDSGYQRPGARPYALPRSTFSAHLAAVAAGPCAPEDVRDIDFTQSGRHLLLTFDDGGRSARMVADELSLHGWRGHFFIVTGRIGERTFLRPSDIIAIRSAGHIIGSHSHTHPDIFRDLSHERMRLEWRVSRDILTALLGELCVTASVPGGDSSPDVLQAASDCGFRYLFTSEPLLRPYLVDRCWILGRLAVKSDTTAARVRELIAFRGWARAHLERRLKVLARLGMGPLYRMYVERSTRPLAGGITPVQPQAPATKSLESRA
jgi:peptidoglycan/xylan/chitin deacetylase (PgdA/CDA1 family)